MGAPRVSKELRDRIRDLLRAGLSYRMIIKECKKEGMKVSIGVIHKVQNGYYENERSNRTKDSKRMPFRVITNSKLNRLKEMVKDANPMTQRDMAKKLKVSQSTVCKLIHKKMDMKTRKKVQVHALTERQIEVRKSRSYPLYRLLNGDQWKKYITTDEAWFYVDESNGKRSIQYVARDEKNPDIECISRRESHAKGLMVWAGISFAGKTRLLFVDPGAKINSQYYIDNILKQFLSRDAKKLYPDGDYVFHQDSAPAHVSKTTYEFMDGKMRFLTKEQTMPKSPDTAPMDYFTWGWMKMRMKRKKVQDTASLKRALKSVWRELPQEMINRALAAWPKRVLKVHKAKGHHIENLKDS